MPRTKATKQQKSAKAKAQQTEAFQLRNGQTSAHDDESQVHILKPGIVCDTEARGHATPQGRSIAEIVVDASQGFIPLWAKNTSLRWRFRERSLNSFTNPIAAKTEIRNLLAEALLDWGTAAPVKFTEDEDVWDFEIVVREADQCSSAGCVLASAFFPDSGRHKLVIYPKMFSQNRKEQVETLTHEIGHVFGLRHFFAEISETDSPSQIFGTHSKFSIMNYGKLSKLTPKDRDDLRRLYQLAWSGALTHINGTKIRFVKPFSALAFVPDTLIAASQIPAVIQPPSNGAHIAGR